MPIPLRNTRTRAHMTERASAPRLALFWFGIQAVWGALLGISLQSRSADLAETNAIALYGILAVSGAAVAAAAQLAAGVWSDSLARRGRGRTGFYVWGALTGACALLWFYTARDVQQLVLSVVALQAGMNLAIGAYQAVVPDAVEPSRYGAASAWMAALQSAGNATGAALAALVADARLVGVLLSALLLLTCGATVAHVRRLPLRAARAGTDLTISQAFVDLFVSRALVYTGFYTLLGYLYFYVAALPRARHLPVKAESGILILLFTVVGVIGAAVAARPSDRYDKRAIVTAGGAIVACALALFVATDSLPLAAVAAGAAGIGWGIFLVADWALACRVLPPGALATAMAIWNLAVVGPQIAAPLLAGALLLKSHILERQNWPRVAFTLAIAEIILGILWIWRLPRGLSVE